MTVDRSPLDLLPFRVVSLLSGDRLVKFASAGLAGTAIDFLLLYLLVEAFAVQLEAAKVVSVEAAIVVMFVINDRWTFPQCGAAGYRPLARRFLRSNLVRTSGLLVAVAILSVLVRLFGVPYLLANAIGIGCGFAANFLAESYYTWRVHR